MYQVSIWLLCPANLLHTQREGGQALFHPGPNGFLSSFYPLSRATAIRSPAGEDPSRAVPGVHSQEDKAPR